MARRPHVLAFPFPVQGHLTPMMQFSHKLAEQGLVVTFITTHYRLDDILRAREAAAAASGHDHQAEDGLYTGNIRLVGIDDGLPEGNPRIPTSMDFINSVDKLGPELEKVLGELSRDNSLPPITCLVSDSFMPWTQDIADKWGFPRAFFWTMSLAVGACFMSIPALKAAGFDPFAQRVKSRGDLAAINFIPGLPPNMDPYDLPFNAEFDSPTQESENTTWLRQVLDEQFSRINEAAWIIVNSFEELEGSIARALHHKIDLCKILLVGPLHNATSSTLFRASLWAEEEAECMKWLDTQRDRSVLYISFGSVVVRSSTAMREVAMALLACRQPFLWAARWGWKDARESFGEEFWEFAMEAGKLTTWTPQPRVLSHRAVGAFLSHGGWNSIVESVSNGVPVLAWPSFLDQFTNSWAIARYWKVGVDLKMTESSSGGIVEHGELERAMHAVLHDAHSCVDMRQRASKLQDAAVASWHPGGSSSQHFHLFLEDMFRRARQNL